MQRGHWNKFCGGKNLGFFFKLDIFFHLVMLWEAGSFVIGTLVILDHSLVRRWNSRSLVWSNLFLVTIPYPWSHFRRTRGTIKTWFLETWELTQRALLCIHSGDSPVGIFSSACSANWLSMPTFTNLGVTQWCLCALCTSYGQTLHEVNTLYSGLKFKVLPECLLANIPVRAANHNKKQGSFCSVLLQQTWSVWKDDREGEKCP